MNKKIITALTCALITISTSALPAFAMSLGSGTVKAYDPKTGVIHWYDKYDFEREGDSVTSYCEKMGYIIVDISAAETVADIEKIEAEFKAAHPDAHYADLGFNHEGINREEFGALSTPSTASTVQTMSDGTKFDPVYYAAANPDVVAAFGTSTNALYNHYVKYGKTEGRLSYAK